ncbi:unnamed protein product, partial [Brassica oleracea]
EAPIHHSIFDVLRLDRSSQFIVSRLRRTVMGITLLLMYYLSSYAKKHHIFNLYF